MAGPEVMMKLLLRNGLGNRAIIGRKLMSVFFLFELTDDNKTRQWDGLLTRLNLLSATFTHKPGREHGILST
jgi:hypothetical protein